MRILKSHFATNMNPSAEKLVDIASEIDERLARVKKWFIVMRNKQLRDGKVITEDSREESNDVQTPTDMLRAIMKPASAPIKIETKTEFPPFVPMKTSPTVKSESEADNETFSKKYRFSEAQMRILKSHFAANRNPSVEKFVDIASEIKDRPARVKKWFEKRRERTEIAETTSASETNENMDTTTFPVEICAASDKSFSNVDVDLESEDISLHKKKEYLEQNELSDYETKILQKCFSNNRHPDAEDITEIAEDINLDIATVQAWFDQRRNSSKIRCSASASKHDFLKSKKGKRGRKFFTPKQVEYLNDRFSINKHPKNDDLEDMAKLLGENESRVNQWFKNKRHKIHNMSPSTTEVNDKIDQVESKRNRQRVLNTKNTVNTRVPSEKETQEMVPQKPLPSKPSSNPDTWNGKFSRYIL